MRILIVDDNKIVNESISDALKEHQYLTDSVYNGEDAIYYIENFDYDCVVLDIMMSLVDGFEVVEKVRNKNINVPILFLSAKHTVEDKVKGLNLGADDYLAKPFSMKELLARIQVLIRQKEGSQKLIYTVNDLSLDADAKIVKRNNQEIKLSQKEYQILLYLIRNKNKVLSRDQILENVWGIDYDGSSNVVDVYINYLRNKIDKEHEIKLIETIYTMGYTIKDET